MFCKESILFPNLPIVYRNVSLLINLNFGIFTTRQRICGKVMFSQVCRMSVYGEGVCLVPVPFFGVGGYAWCQVPSGEVCLVHPREGTPPGRYTLMRKYTPRKVHSHEGTPRLVPSPFGGRGFPSTSLEGTASWKGTPHGRYTPQEGTPWGTDV